MMNTSLAGIDELLRLHPPTHPVLVEVMVRDYRVAVYRLALSLLADPDDAEDATQETFIKAARYLARYRAGTNFRAWIFQITVNTCRSLLRKRAARANLQRMLNMGMPPSRAVRSNQNNLLLSATLAPSSGTWWGVCQKSSAWR
jgi:RNA polymerase sigma factor (sigma-70 family)